MPANITVRRGKTVEMAAVEGVKVWWEGIQGLRPNRMTPAEARHLETVRAKAGMTWEIGRAPFTYRTEAGQDITWGERFALYRKDTGAPLGVCSDKYRVVQPAQILEFFADIVKLADARIETAGTLYGGRKFWAMARLNKAEDAVAKGDVIHPYLLASTTADGSGGTHVMETSTAVVCSNTLAMALGGKGSQIYIPHSADFNAQTVEDVKQRLALTAKNFGAFMSAAKQLAKAKIDADSAAKFIETLLRDRKVIAAEDPLKSKGFVKIMDLFKGEQLGAEVKARQGTLWGLVNAVTEYVDHNEKRTNSAAIETAWFGWGNALKSEALKRALELV